LAGFRVIKDSFMPSIQDRLTKAVLGQVVRDRNGDKIDTGMLKEVLTTYVTLGYADVDIKLDNGVYQWSPAATVGNNAMYDKYFEDPLKIMVTILVLNLQFLFRLSKSMFRNP
jgi:hypothetical protein